MTWALYLLLGAWLAYWFALAGFALKRRGMFALRYLVLSPVFWLVIFARYAAAFPAVYFARDFKIRPPFLWISTIDNDLRGDSGHQAEHMLGKDPSAWWNQVLWLWRNGGNHFNYYTIGVSDSTAPPWAFWDKVAIRLPFGRFLDVRVGWSPEGPKQGRRKYVMTARIKTKP
jgi:hypothetical protein